MATGYSPQDRYREYLECQGLLLTESLSAQIETLAAKIDWNEPKTATDHQATAVIALVEAELTEDIETRRLYVEMAFQSLETAFATGEPSLAAVQWGIVQAQLGNLGKAQQLAFSELVSAAELAYQSNPADCQFVYLPGKSPGSSGVSTAEHLSSLLQSSDLQAQRLVLAAETLCRGQLVLYNQGGARSLQTLSHLAPDSISLNRKLGIYKLANRELEGFIPLYKAHSQTALSASVDAIRSATALQLAAQQYQSAEKAEIWAKQAQQHREKLAQNEAPWRQPSAEAACVYLPYDSDICFAAEPTLNSIVTRVLLAEGDWFEREMTLWRDLIQPGMTVIDVGANSGVYTFSAAKRVGPTGKVIAIEPFQGCVNCLQQTCQVNKFDWVRVCAAAASDLPGTSFLTLHTASELNEIRPDQTVEDAAGVQEIRCINLDSLIDSEELERVDFLKIDAEGHETKVLAGATELIEKFQPFILYENIAGQQSANLEMATALQAAHYQLFSYQPWIEKLIPIESESDLDGVLNIIAVSSDNSSTFIQQLL